MRDYRIFIVGLTLLVVGGVGAYLGITVSAASSSGLGVVSGGIKPIGVIGVLFAILGIAILAFGAARNYLRR